jgi:hypothetical protein
VRDSEAADATLVAEKGRVDAVFDIRILHTSVPPRTAD